MRNGIPFKCKGIYRPKETKLRVRKQRIMESTVLKKLTKETRMTNDRWVSTTQWNNGKNLNVVSDQGGPEWGREGILQRRILWSKRQTFMMKDFMTFWKTSVRVSKCCSSLEQSVWGRVTSLGVYPILPNRVNGINSNFESWFWKKGKSNSIPNVMNKWVMVKNEMVFKGTSLPNIWRSGSTTRITRSAEFKGQTMFGCVDAGVLLKPASSLYTVTLGLLKASKKDRTRQRWVHTVSRGVTDGVHHNSEGCGAVRWSIWQITTVDTES